MSKLRIKGGADGAGYYHVMSRTVADTEGGLMMFGPHEKNVFAKHLRRYAEFTGIEVLTWCMMDNHFHLLIKVPQKEGFLESLMANGRAKFWTRLSALHGRAMVHALRAEVEMLEGEDGTRHRADTLIESYARRMADLSTFVKELKQAFAIWFNHKYERRGTLWMERFNSVLLEGEPRVLKKVAAYIDLNPIRAGLVEDPASYRWSGYGQAIGGKVEARRGLSAVYAYGRNEWRRVSGDYRQLLYLEGVAVRGPDGTVIRTGFSDAEFHRETANDGSRPLTTRLSDRVRYFTDGVAIGSREFLERVFESNRTMFGPARKVGGHKFRGKEWKDTELFSIRDLSAG